MFAAKLSKRSSLRSRAIRSKWNLKVFPEYCQADSSLVEPHYYSETITVETCRLDDLPSLEHIKKIKLLKIEAEGFEPEILKGAIKTIQKTKYIAVEVVLSAVLISRNIYKCCQLFS